MFLKNEQNKLRKLQLLAKGRGEREKIVASRRQRGGKGREKRRDRRAKG